MPMIRISTAYSYSDQQKQDISNLIQTSMETYFDTPKNDRFHIFEQLPKQHVFVDADYWVEASRTEKFILIYITSGKVRSSEQKLALMQDVTQGLGEKFDIPEQDIMFVIVQNTMQDWCFGHAERADLKLQRLQFSN